MHFNIPAFYYLLSNTFNVFDIIFYIFLFCASLNFFLKIQTILLPLSFFFLIIYLFNLFYFWLCWVFVSVRGLSPVVASGGHSSSRCAGFSRCGAQAPDVQAQQLWLTGLVAPRHVGSSQTRARTRVPCIGRQILNHCANGEAPTFVF